MSDIVLSFFFLFYENDFQGLSAAANIDVEQWNSDFFITISFSYHKVSDTKHAGVYLLALLCQLSS